MTLSGKSIVYAGVCLCAYLALASFAAAAVPDHWEGYLIDLTCARERKDKEPGLGAAHTRNCLAMPACERSGFGLLSDTNEVWRFDEAGNRKVRILLMQTKRDAGLRIVVRGNKLGDVITIQQIAWAGRNHGSHVGQ